MKRYEKQDLAVEDVRRYLEPGPIVLLSSAHKGERNIMTMGWHMVMEFSPSLVGCYIWDRNHSFEMIRRSKQCVINVPTHDMIDAIIGVGNCSGTDTDKFAQFKLTATPATKVDAPLIAECHVSFECRLADATMIKRRGLFVFEVVKAHVAARPKYPRTVHYRGDGVFMISGRSVSYRRRFKPGNL